ncbi:MAG: serine hydrolase domain-containing protein [Gammaproteobacteria bacterium]|nr:serine hydrolase domain-containing protein [Gammaproteobacteria bacterium]
MANTFFDKGAHLSFLKKIMGSYNVNVVGFAIIDDYKIVETKTLSQYSEIKVSDQSLFQACSLSKSLTAAAVLHLCSKNKISLGIPLNAQLSLWKIRGQDAENVTISQCLSMTSGLCYGDQNLSFPNYSHDAPIPKLMDILNGVSPAITPSIKLGTIPGLQYAYTGTGYMALQQLIEEQTFMSFDTFMTACIFPSLIMTHSTFECPLTKWQSDAIPGFSASGEMNPAGWDNIPTSASGGLWSTPTDIANFAIFIAKTYLGEDNSLFPQSLAKEMLRKQKNTNFGLGFVIDQGSRALNFRKNGSNSGFNNEIIMFPETGQGVVVMTNSAGGLALIKEFTAYVAKKLNWPHYQPEFDEVALK